MIASLKPPYDISAEILKLISSISTKLGEVNANFLNRQSPQLRKQNQIKTIHASLQIEGNTLSEEQITAIIDKKNVIGPEKDVKEVMNAIDVYDILSSYNPDSEKSFLEAHRRLMTGLIDKPGRYRNKGVGIVQGSKIAHVAPPAENVPYLMKDLFNYVKNDDDLTIIKSCVFHYEMEFIHPFADGNGRMGRLWQTVILIQEMPVFEFLPFETLIAKTQLNYYNALAESDKAGKSTKFIEYMLDVMDKALGDLLQYNNRILKAKDRLEYFLSLGIGDFSRKDYMNVFKDISTSTASRDLSEGVEMNLFQKYGGNNRTRYRIQ
jgi:Fic family protein